METYASDSILRKLEKAINMKLWLLWHAAGKENLKLTF